jgi:hypothetical protein
MAAWTSRPARSAATLTDTRWGFSTHIKVLLICTQCRYVLTFYDKNSIFDFD